MERSPDPVVLADGRGTIVYGNPAARTVLGGGPLEGRTIDEVLDPAVRAASHCAERPGGGTAWYLGHGADRPGRTVRFAAEVGEALAGSLNLRRTLARVADLAVPALGSWASVTLVDPVEVRRVVRPEGEPAEERVRPAARVPDDERRRVQAAMEAGIEQAMLTAADAIAFGAGGAGAGVPAAGTPVVTVPLQAHGSELGLLVVAGRPGRPPDHEAVTVLARRAAVALSAARVYEERSALASTLRAALLPATLPVVPGVAIGSAYRPAQEATEIGGDFYEVRADGDGWSFSVGDVCGKGVDAAVLTGQVRQSLRTVSLVDAAPEDRLHRLNEALLATDGTSFVTLVHGTIRSTAAGLELHLAGGGHPAPLVRRSDGRVEELPVAGPIIGMLDVVRFEPVTMVLRPGETLACFTDGLPDAPGDSGLLGVDRLAAVLADCEGMVAQAIAERLLQAALEHLDGRPHDDIALLVLQADPARGGR